VTAPRRRYRTDLTDAQWRILAPLIPRPSPAGGRRSTSGASCSTRCCIGCGRAARGGCYPTTCRPGRPPTIISAAGGWKGAGCTSCECCASGSGPGRAAGPRPAPRSSTAKASRPPKGGPHGYDGAKKPGRPQAAPAGRHVGPAAGRARDPRGHSDRHGAAELLRRLDRRQLPRLRYGWADGGYRGAFLAWALARCKIAFEVVQRADGGRRRRWLPPVVEPPVVPRFAVMPRRWVVERTFAWLGRFRRLGKDYEYLPATSEAVIQLAMIQLLVRRLVLQPVRPEIRR
jgi:putative transposase